MSSNLLGLLMSVAATFFCCTVGSLLLWGNDAGASLIGSIFYALPVFMLIFAGFYLLFDKLVTKHTDFLNQKNILFDPNHAREDHETWSKFLKFIGYLEVASGFLGIGITFIGIVFTKQPIAINLLNLAISLFFFLSGVLLLNKTDKGLKLSLICQLLTMFSIKSAFFSFSSTMMIDFKFNINFGSSVIGVNFMSLVFAAIIAKAISKQHNKPIRRTENGSALN